MMNTSAADRLRSAVKSARSLGVATADVSVETLDAVLRDLDRIVDAFEQLAVCVGALDFDSTESALPGSQEQWIEFVRGLDEQATKIYEAAGL